MRALALVILVMSSVVHADPAKPARRTPAAAVLISIGVTLAGTVMTLESLEWGPSERTWMGLGLMHVGPSTGRWYAGNPTFGGLALRGVGTVAIMYGIAQGAFSRRTDGANGPALGLIGGVGLWLGATVTDIVFAHGDAVDFNKRHAITVAPVQMQTPSGSATGLVLGGRF